MKLLLRGNIAGKLTTPASADDGQWLMPAKDYANTRYSDLDQINTGNVKNLKVAWTFSTGHRRGHEAAPLVVGQHACTWSRRSRTSSTPSTSRSTASC